MAGKGAMAKIRVGQLDYSISETDRMKPLRVALVHRVAESAINRTIGYWSYPVPEFEITHMPQSKGFVLSKGEIAREHDLIFYEDGKLFGQFIGKTEIPICYLIIDSTLSDEHYRVRRSQAEQADLLLVDWDKLDRWNDLGVPVKRFSYCVNNKLFGVYGMDKTIDVGLYMTFDSDRRYLHEWLESFCKSKGYSYHASSKLYGKDYAEAFSRTKIAINFNRNPFTRAHRIFDAMASRCCLLTSPLPEVSGENFIMGFHYRDFDMSNIGDIIDDLLPDKWEYYADMAYDYVIKNHIWSIRAKQLYDILMEEFPWLSSEEIKSIDVGT